MAGPAMIGKRVKIVDPRHPDYRISGEVTAPMETIIEGNWYKLSMDNGRICGAKESQMETENIIPAGELK